MSTTYAYEISYFLIDKDTPQAPIKFEVLNDYFVAMTKYNGVLKDIKTKVDNMGDNLDSWFVTLSKINTTVCQDEEGEYLNNRTKVLKHEGNI